jgi:hypothetical protein
MFVPSRCEEVSATIFSKRTHLRRVAVSPIRRFVLLCPFELGVKGIKTFEAFGEDLLIGQTLLGPTFEDLFNSEAFDPVKLFVFQIRVMNKLRDSQNRAISNSESFDSIFLASPGSELPGYLHPVPSGQNQSALSSSSSALIPCACSIPAQVCCPDNRSSSVGAKSL